MNVAVAATGLLTAPLLARALGADGRGDLAAILVPLSVLPAVLGLGAPTFVYRELPRGRPVGEVLGSLALPMLFVGALTAATALPLANALADGRPTVRLFLLIGLLLMPLALVGRVYAAALVSLELWSRVIWTRVIPFLVPAAAILLLFAADRLTVGAVAAVNVAAGVLGLAPCAVLLRRYGRPRFRGSVAREGLRYGAESWLGGLAFLANTRLDQFVMVGAVPPRELGLYAVAVTLSGVSGLATGALGPPLMGRIGRGEVGLLPRALRITLAGTLLLNGVVAILTPIALPVLFGSDFQAAVPMTLILLAANVFWAGSAVLSAALQAGGSPRVPSVAEAVALMVTAAGLLLLLGPLGGVGAALVSLIAYALAFVIQLVFARRRFTLDEPFIWPQFADIEWLMNTFVTRRQQPGSNTFTGSNSDVTSHIGVPS